MTNTRASPCTPLRTSICRRSLTTDETSRVSSRVTPGEARRRSSATKRFTASTTRMTSCSFVLRTSSLPARTPSWTMRSSSRSNRSLTVAISPSRIDPPPSLARTTSSSSSRTPRRSSSKRSRMSCSRVSMVPIGRFTLCRAIAPASSARLTPYWRNRSAGTCTRNWWSEKPSTLTSETSSRAWSLAFRFSAYALRDAASIGPLTVIETTWSARPSCRMTGASASSGKVSIASASVRTSARKRSVSAPSAIRTTLFATPSRASQRISSTSFTPSIASSMGRHSASSTSRAPAPGQVTRTSTSGTPKSGRVSRRISGSA